MHHNYVWRKNENSASRREEKRGIYVDFLIHVSSSRLLHTNCLSSSTVPVWTFLLISHPVQKGLFIRRDKRELCAANRDLQGNRVFASV